MCAAFSNRSECLGLVCSVIGSSDWNLVNCPLNMPLCLGSIARNRSAANDGLNPTTD